MSLLVYHVAKDCRKLKKYGIGMSSSGITFMPRFVKIGQQTHTHTHTHTAF